MTDEVTWPGKGKGKRVASGDLEITAPSPPIQITVPKVRGPVIPKIIRRHKHRRRNVAATVWGPQLPMAPHKGRGIPFNLYKAIVRHPNLFFQFAIRLPLQTLVDLYAIDKEFHFRFNKYSISIIAEHATYHAADAAYIFSWKMFPELCISDPLLKPMDGRPHLARDIPSLRWVKMVMFRDTVTRVILTDVAMQGLRVPQGTHVALMKFWLLMEMQTMAMREAFLRDQKVWTNDDLLCFLHFVLKLDMRIIHPVFGAGICGLSHMMLTQKSLTPLYDLLLNKEPKNERMDYDLASDLLVRTYLPDMLDLDTYPWLTDEATTQIKPEEVGLMCREGWEIDGEPLTPALDMVMTEAISRGLHPQQYLLEWMLYGFMDYDTGKNIPAPRKWRKEKEVHTPKEAWPSEEERKSVIAKLDVKVDVKDMRKEPQRPMVPVNFHRLDGVDVRLGWAVDMGTQGPA
ncbi:hypothetical protein K458DRAFT_300645 [Lentithecium fluviatile CBS 122367]|uniref:Uncharacterized protein n=1 Tax=Lentithecium fluviatile CBS 122367 TaxID=1168545 RepID=A0A6G1J413_9PLEO|nr:hypothetical protein K458DRAFT_300645 [Lentithecium fluviatile CBS 122367]